MDSRLFSLITWVSFFLAFIYCIPAILTAKLYEKIARILLASAKRKYGHIGGRRSKVALRLQKRAHIIMDEVTLDILTYATQLEQEDVMKAIDATKPFPYVLKAERKLDPKDQTTFMLKNISCSEQASLQDDLYNVEGLGKERRERFLTGTRMREVLKSNLVGWENLLDDDGNQVIFDRTNPYANLDRLPAKVRMELADVITGDQEVSEGEGKS